MPLMSHDKMEEERAMEAVPMEPVGISRDMVFPMKRAKLTRPRITRMVATLSLTFVWTVSPETRRPRSHRECARSRLTLPCTMCPSLVQSAESRPWNLNFMHEDPFRAEWTPHPSLNGILAECTRKRGKRDWTTRFLWSDGVSLRMEWSTGSDGTRGEPIGERKGSLKWRWGRITSELRYGHTLWECWFSSFFMCGLCLLFRRTAPGVCLLRRSQVRRKFHKDWEHPNLAGTEWEENEYFAVIIYFP